jgi:hypothetical protein
MTSLKIMMSGAAPLGAPMVNALRNRLKLFGAEVAVVQGSLCIRQPYYVFTKFPARLWPDGDVANNAYPAC